MEVHMDEDWLREKYYDEGLSTEEIGELANRSGSTIRYHMKKHGIERRNPHEGMFYGAKYKDPEWLYQKYVEEDLTTDEMGDLAGVYHTTISRHLKENGIGVERQSGENHYNWNGGTSTTYGRGWNKTRELTIKRDYGRCRICNLSREEHKEKFGCDIHVHHRTPRSFFLENYDRETARDKMDALQNLITLCKSCHMHIERRDLAHG